MNSSFSCEVRCVIKVDVAEARSNHAARSVWPSSRVRSASVTAYCGKRNSRVNGERASCWQKDSFTIQRAIDGAERYETARSALRRGH
jgi:hypothetical protein